MAVLTCIQMPMSCSPAHRSWLIMAAAAAPGHQPVMPWPWPVQSAHDPCDCLQLLLGMMQRAQTLAAQVVV